LWKPRRCPGEIYLWKPVECNLILAVTRWLSSTCAHPGNLPQKSPLLEVSTRCFGPCGAATCPAAGRQKASPGPWGRRANQARAE